MPRFRYNTDDCGNNKSQQDEDRYYADQESRSDAEREFEAEESERQFYESLPDECVSGNENLCILPGNNCRICFNP